MSKKRRERINDNLAKALEPPKRPAPSPRGLDDILKDYEDPISDRNRDQRSTDLTRPTVASEPIEPPSPSPLSTEPTAAPVPTLTRPTVGTQPTLSPEPKPARLTVAQVNGELRIPNTIIDSLLPLLDTMEQALYLRLYRLSHGYHKDTCTVGFDRLVETTGISKNSLKRVVFRLEKLGLVERIGASFGGAVKGNCYRVYLPDTVTKESTEPTTAPQTRPASVPRKGSIKDLKKQINKIISQLAPSYVGAGKDEFRKAVERACSREGVSFDLDLYNEIIGKL
jgi:hypothetical protein